MCWSPYRLSEGVIAASGALAVVLLGLVPVRDAIDAVAQQWDVLLFFVALLLIASSG